MISAVVTILNNVAPTFIEQRPKDELPAIVVSTIATERQYHMSGPLGLPTATVECNVYAKTYAQVEELADEVRAYIDGEKHSGMTFFVTNQTDSSEVNEPGSAILHRCISFDLEIHYAE